MIVARTDDGEDGGAPAVPPPGYPRVEEGRVDQPDDQDQVSFGPTTSTFPSVVRPRRAGDDPHGQNGKPQMIAGRPARRVLARRQKTHDPL